MNEREFKYTMTLDNGLSILCRNIEDASAEFQLEVERARREGEALPKGAVIYIGSHSYGLDEHGRVWWNGRLEYHAPHVHAIRLGEKLDRILWEIDQWQAAQKAHAPASQMWQRASRHLSPLFAEMSRRQAAGLLPAGLTIAGMAKPAKRRASAKGARS